MRQNKYIFLYILLIFSLLNACSDSGKNARQPDIDKYITGYSSGIVKAASSIYINLGVMPDKEYQPGSLLPADILEITPKTKGELYLKDSTTLEFIPSEKLQNGTTYGVTLHLGTLCDVPAPYRKFSFEFKVIPLNLLFEEGTLLTDETNDTLLYQAVLYSSDEMQPDAISRKVEARLENNALPVEWQHMGNTHRFIVKKITKGEKSKRLLLSLDKDITNGGEQEITIPGKQDFCVLDVRLNEEQPLSVRIVMSEKVDPDQDLKGLTSISGSSTANYKTEGNIIYLYPEIKENTDILEIEVHKGIRSSSGKTLNAGTTHTLRMPSSKPMVKFIGNGVFTPAGGKLLIPFSAVALKAVELVVIKVPEQNMNFFLQENAYDNSYELRRTGRPIFRKKIELLKGLEHLNTERWNDFTINLSDLVQLEQGVVYRIELKFNKSYTTLECAGEEGTAEKKEEDWDTPGYYSDYEYPEDYKWQERDNPCSSSYYTGERFARKNIINTSLGLLSKRTTDGKYIVCVSDLATAEAVNGCEVTLYNYQNLQIGQAQTDREGFASVKPEGKAFIIKASKGKDKTYLRVGDANALSLSNFDISGQNVQMGVKGFIYGEREVWRPGDRIYLSLILEDKLNVLPAGHPVIAQLADPKGNVIQTRTGHTGENHIHCFDFKTNADAPTGYWHAIVKIGGLTLTKTIRVETVKPNRLSIVTTFPNENIIGTGISSAPVRVKTKWLHGAKTPAYKAVTEVKLNTGNTEFKGYAPYTFDDKTKYFEPRTELLFEGKTDAEGNFSFSTDKIKAENAPGILNASFTTRIFENSGDFSIATTTVRYSPFSEYVGIKLPASEDGWYTTDSPVRLDGVTLDAKGNKAFGSTIELSVWKLDWRWWWDAEYDNPGSYINRSYSKAIFNKTVTSAGGSFSTDLNLKEWGRYYISATDKKSGHTTAIIAYFGSWNNNRNPEMATMLSINCDKKSYKAGEKIKIKIPSSAGGVAIVSLENGKTVKDIFRVPTTKGSTTIELKATSDMCPNIYAHITLIQPYNGRDNDRPVRLYGVTNINVEDPSLHLNPQIQVAPELRPAEEFTVTVSEKQGQPMNYTIAIVDEGLLSLTSFKTPDPFQAFYAREALGVKTWDFYDYIFGAYGARLDKAFATGGDEALKPAQDEKINRFKPVVLFEGPFTLKKGKSARHTFRMPEYIGEVRTMVIAAGNSKYGSATASSQVKKPLMLSMALPRTLTPGDRISLPVTVFTMNNSIKEVKVTLTASNEIEITGATTQTVKFSEQGEQIVYFQVKVKEITGNTTLKAEVRSGNEKAVVTENVEIRIPNPRMTRVEARQLKAGESVTFNTVIEGAAPLSVIEIASIPPLNLEQRLDYLISYPHGCVEQITSTVFPQLFLDKLTPLPPASRAGVETNVKEVINRLSSYQTPEGGFAYWQGGSTPADWVSSYVTHFLIIAQQKGYALPARMLPNALNYLKKTTNNWRDQHEETDMEQAYRLYILALSGKPDLAAMNRLKESQLSLNTAQWLLASAYALSNHPDAGRSIIRNATANVAPYRRTGGNYGSDTRDNALILLSMVYLNRQQDAYRMLEKISRPFASGEWMSTQSTAFGLLAAAAYVDKYVGTPENINVQLKSAGGVQQINSGKTIVRQSIKLNNGKAFAEIKNNGKSNLYIHQINSATPLRPVNTRTMNGLLMTIKYLDNQGTPVDLTTVKQGQDMVAAITVRNTGMTGKYDELALSYLLPSGFEIINERLAGNMNAYKEADHTDIRDDRFYLYFSLNQNHEKTFRFRFNAAFAGEYIIPAVTCSAMYDNTIEAVLPGGNVTIGK